ELLALPVQAAWTKSSAARLRYSSCSEETVDVSHPDEDDRIGYLAPGANPVSWDCYSAMRGTFFFSATRIFRRCSGGDPHPCNVKLRQSRWRRSGDDNSASSSPR